MNTKTSHRPHLGLALAISGLGTIGAGILSPCHSQSANSPMDLSSIPTPEGAMRIGIVSIKCDPNETTCNNAAAIAFATKDHKLLTQIFVRTGEDKNAVTVCEATGGKASSYSLAQPDAKKDIASGEFDALGRTMVLLQHLGFDTRAQQLVAGTIGLSLKMAASNCLQASTQPDSAESASPPASGALTAPQAGPAKPKTPAYNFPSPKPFPFYVSPPL